MLSELTEIDRLDRVAEQKRQLAFKFKMIHQEAVASRAALASIEAQIAAGESPCEVALRTVLSVVDDISEGLVTRSTGMVGVPGGIQLRFLLRSQCGEALTVCTRLRESLQERVIPARTRNESAEKSLSAFIAKHGDMLKIDAVA